ncbi:hypothetical protein Tco_0568249 [Tanacetum coccineum]
MAEIGSNWARIGPSKSSQSLSNAHKWAVVIDWGPFGLHSLLNLYYWAFQAHQDGLSLHPIVFFSLAFGLTADLLIEALKFACFNVPVGFDAQARSEDGMPYTYKAWAGFHLWSFQGFFSSHDLILPLAHLFVGDKRWRDDGGPEETGVKDLLAVRFPMILSPGGFPLWQAEENLRAHCRAHIA